MFKLIMERIADMTLYPVLALLIFFIFFLSLLYWLWHMDHDHLKYLENLPLEPQSGGNHE
jgi:hypothetical protein